MGLRIFFTHAHTCNSVRGQDSLKLFINDDTTPFAAVKHSRFVVKIPVEVPDDCTVRFEGKLWYRQTHLPDAPKKQIAFKASHVAASLANKEVGLVPLDDFGRAPRVSSRGPNPHITLWSPQTLD